jgi:hypothetical protein
MINTLEFYSFLQYIRHLSAISSLLTPFLQEGTCDPLIDVDNRDAGFDIVHLCLSDWLALTSSNWIVSVGKHRMATPSSSCLADGSRWSKKLKLATTLAGK